MLRGYSVELGPTPCAIAMAARRTGADAIVLGRRRRLDWRDALIGDVTGEVVRRADRSVLVAGPRTWRGLTAEGSLTPVTDAMGRRCARCPR